MARVGGTCGPLGSSGWRSVGLGFVFGFALLEPEALAIHLEHIPSASDIASVMSCVDGSRVARIFVGAAIWSGAVLCPAC